MIMGWQLQYFTSSYAFNGNSKLHASNLMTAELVRGESIQRAEVMRESIADNVVCVCCDCEHVCEPRWATVKYE